MVKDNKKAPGSIIAAEMSIDGDVRFAGAVEINGRISGMVEGDNAELGRSGTIVGDVVVKDFDCGGTVKGAVSSQRVRMRTAAIIEGNISAVELEMVPGSVFVGEMKIGKEPGRPPERSAGTNSEVGPEGSYESGSSDVVLEGANRQKTPAEADAEVKEDGSLVDGLVGALRGGSSVIMVVSEEAASRRLVYDELKDRLNDSYVHLFIDEPTGSFGEMLLKVAGGFGVELSDYSDQETMIRDLAESMAGSGRYILVLDNVERMYPATLERMIRYLAADEKGENEVTKLILLGSEDLKKMIDFGDSRVFIREPDCVFEL